MKDKYFLDTNVLVYSFDTSAPTKQKKAQKLIATALNAGDGFISLQVVQEFINVTTKKFGIGFKDEDLSIYLKNVLYSLCQVYPDTDLMQEALDLHYRIKYSFYDSLIIASAIRGEASILYSEDLSDGQKVGALTIVNPF
ncbi:PIN domain-containing protein [bacterium]|nr:PIN domain-containing protein [bacterium]